MPGSGCPRCDLLSLQNSMLQLALTDALSLLRTSQVEARSLRASLNQAQLINSGLAAEVRRLTSLEMTDASTQADGVSRLGPRPNPYRIHR